jgi:putative inorganic carbon (HCO3(-)) transporter
MGEKNTLGGYLVLIGTVAAGVLLHSESGRERTCLYVLLAALISVLLYSLSRSSWVAAIVSIIVLFYTARRRSMYLVVIILLFVIFPFIVPEIVTKRFAFTFSQEMAPHYQQVVIGPFRLDTSLSSRLFDYLKVLRRWPDHPLFGFGVAGFQFVDGQFFRILIEMGLAGLLSFFAVLASLHNLVRKAMNADIGPRLRGMTAGFYAGFWAMIAHALSTNTFIIVRIAEPFWCLAALTVVCAIHKDEDWRGGQPPPDAKSEYIPSKELWKKSTKYFYNSGNI